MCYPLQELNRTLVYGLSKVKRDKRICPVNVRHKNLESTVVLWAGLGPFLITLALLMSLIKGISVSVYIPLFAVACFPLCWKWRRRGLFFSIVGLALLSAITYSSIEALDPLWTAGLAAALGLGLMIMTLSFEELIAVIRTLQEQGMKRLNIVSTLELDLQGERDKWLEKDSVAQRQIVSMTTDLEEYKILARSREKLASVLQEEYKQLEVQKEALLEDLFQTQRDNARLSQDLEESTDAYLKEDLHAMSDALKQREEDLVSIQAALRETGELYARSEERQRLQEQVILEGKYETEKLQGFVKELELTVERLSPFESKFHERVNQLNALRAKVFQESLNQPSASHIESVETVLNQKLEDQILKIQALEEGDQQLSSDLSELLEETSVTIESLEEEKQQLSSDLSELLEETSAKIESLEGENQQLNSDLRELLEGESAKNLNEQKKATDLSEQLQDKIVKIQSLEAALSAAETKPLEPDLEPLTTMMLSLEEKLAEIQRLRDKKPKLTDSERTLRNMEGLYNQLRNQFENKSQVLHETRSQLFKSEGALMAFEINKALTSVEQPYLQHKLQTDLIRVENERAQFEEEIELLYDLVDTLTLEINAQ